MFPVRCVTYVPGLYQVPPGLPPAEVRDALERHLRHEPTRVSKSRIKRLRGLSQP